MQCPQCSAEIQNDKWTACPSCGSPLAPNLAVRLNSEAMAGAAGAGLANAASKRGGSAALWITLLIVVAIVVAFVLLHH